MFEKSKFSTYSSEFKTYARDGALLLGAGYSISYIPDTLGALDILRDGVSYVAYILGGMEVLTAGVVATDVIRHKLKPSVK